MTEGIVASLVDRYPGTLRDCPDYRQEVHVFRDRRQAGEVLADLLGGRDAGRTLILAVPAGGVPVAVALAERLALALDVACVSKVTVPGNTEVGCGAVAFDGTLEMNEPLLRRLGFSSKAVAERIEATREKVQRRQQALRPGRGELDPTGRDAILVDDGLASGFTMRLAVEAVRKLGPDRVSVAVPTAPASTAEDLIPHVDELWCANLRAGARFAVADAYRNWRDVSEDEAADMLRRSSAT